MVRCVNQSQREFKILKITVFSDVLVKVANKCKDKITLEDLQKIVSECRKQRFHLEKRENKWFIRANQGHTMKNIEQGLKIFEFIEFFPFIYLIIFEQTFSNSF